MANKLKDIPTFKSEDEEREFWATHDSTDYIDWDLAEAVVLPKLKPSTKTISLRLPEMMLNELRLIANKRDIPYQSLIKMFLKERIDQELKQYSEAKAPSPRPRGRAARSPQLY
jgi:predicted DNA binding CopG/RHH family protein